MWLATLRLEAHVHRRQWQLQREPLVPHDERRALHAGGQCGLPELGVRRPQRVGCLAAFRHGGHEAEHIVVDLCGTHAPWPSTSTTSPGLNRAVSSV